ncbi:MAG: tetratricopeptide repeat protein [Nitrospiraceae bacterium]
MDRSTVLQNAQLFASRGQFDAAIAEWKKLTAESPTDGSIYNTIGDLHLKRNASSEAIAAYLQAASAFRAEGAPVKAIAAYKKILKVDPKRYEVYRHLGDLNAERGLLSSAVTDYLTLGKFYLREGKAREALEVYRTIANQDPTNFDARQRVAELCLQQNLHDEAIQVYLQLGRERSAQQRRDEARDAYLAVLRIDPGNPEAEQFIRMLSEAPPDSQRPAPSDSARGSAATKGQDSPNLLGEALRRMNEGQYAGAEAILSQLLSQEPGNPEVCQLLAKLHLKRGDLAVALNEYRFLGGAAMRAQDYDLAESLIGEYLNVDPACVALLELRGDMYEKKGDGEAAAIQYGKALEVLLEHPEPGMPTLPAELYAKINMLAPTSPLVSRFTSVFESTQPTQSPQEATARQHLEHPSQPTEIVPPQSAHEPSVTEAPKKQEGASTSTAETALEPDEQEKPSEQGYETHYTLGVAYKDMGLLEEAVEELNLAAKGTECALDASIMLAACLKEQGTNRAAISYLEQALADPHCKGEKAVSVRYELGILYEAEGRFDSALRILETIPTFQDVPQRIEWMKSNGQFERPSSTNPRQRSSDPVTAASGKPKAAGDQPDRKKRRISYL